jgi:ribA/ribD-fused uncharacterized protein
MQREIRFYRANDSYGFLSNLYRLNPFLFFEDRYYETSEAAYQFGKPADMLVAEWIVSAPKPHLIAAAAHALLVYDVRKDWQKIKVSRMKAVLTAKFTQNDELRQMLLSTGDAKLIETSNTDAFWGCGKKGDGKNMLGVLLMEVREELRRQACKHERLNEEGQCRSCGTDCRGIGGGA